MDVQTDAALVAMEVSQTPSAPAAKNFVPPVTKGFPLEIMFNKTEEKFRCGYCKLVLRSPMQSDCGHRFCKPCCDAMLRSGVSNVCSACEEEGTPREGCILDLSTMFEDKAAIREMKKMHTKCNNQGCTWKGAFQDYMIHEDVCEKKMMTCSLCGTPVSKARIVHHETKACVKREVECQHCLEKVVSADLEKHNSVCPEYPLRCDKCAMQLKRKEMNTHKEFKCVHRTIQCPVPDCKMKLSMEQFPGHINKTSLSTQKHLVFILDKINQLEQDLRTLTLPPVPQGTVSGASGDQAQAPLSTAAADSSTQQDMAEEGAVGGSAISSLDQNKLKLHEDLMAVLHGEILRCINKVEALDRQIEQHEKKAKDFDVKLNDVSRSVGLLEIKVQENPQPKTLTDWKDGNALWRINNFSQARRAAINSSQTFVDSPSFYTSPGGYKLRLRLYPNGDGSQRGSSLSLYVQILKGEHDEILPWPFAGKVYAVIVDQKKFSRHVKNSFMADPSNPGSQQPESNENPAFGCSNFCALNDLAQAMDAFMARDTMFIRVKVEAQVSALERLQNLDPKMIIQSAH